MANAVCEELRRRWRVAAPPLERAAYAVALGILRDDGSAPAILAQLRKSRREPLYAHLCTALGLLQYRDATPLLLQLAKERIDPRVREKAILALGLIGGDPVIPDLLEILRDRTNAHAVLGAVARAIALIGGDDAIDPLLEMASDRERYGMSTRAFSVASLGMLFDRESPPQLRQFSANANYTVGSDALRLIRTIL